MPAKKFQCGNCGGKVPVPEGHTKAKIRCPLCGYYADVPDDLRSLTPDESHVPQTPFDEPPKKRPARPTPDEGESYSLSEPAPEPEKPKPPRPRARPRVDPRDHRPDFITEDGPKGAPLLEGTQEEHDDIAVPYAVPGTGLKPCSNCQGELPLDATFCVHCGTDLLTGDVIKEKVVRPINLEWEEYVPYKFRLRVFIVLQFVNALLVILAMIANKQSFTDLGTIATNFIGNLFHIGLQAFLLGTFDTFALKRTSRGQTTLQRTRRIAFIKLPVEKIPWKQHVGSGVMATHNPGVVGWLIMVYMCELGLLPGVLFYWFVIRPERFDVALCDLYGGAPEILFRTRTRELAAEISQTIAEATGLEYRKIL